MQPFRTLWQQTWRWQAPPHLHIPSQQSLLPSNVHSPHSQPMFTQYHPSGIGPGKPIVIVLFEMPASAPPVPILDWDSDPRLMNLSHALYALGWTPPCWVFLFYFLLFTTYIIGCSFTAHSITGILDIILDIILYLEFHSDKDVTIWDVGIWSSQGCPLQGGHMI